MIKINQNEKDEIQAWINMIKSPDQEAWFLAKSLIWSSSFYKRNKEMLDTLLYICCEGTEHSVYFNDAVDFIADSRWELIEIFNLLINPNHESGYLADGSEIEIEYENNR
jgi:hypothetical protein